MIAVLTLIVVLILSMVIVRVATVALTLTGLSEPLAKFQARSAFFGVGFTTKESENVVNHPLRRRIITALMLMGQVGFITTAATLIGSFALVEPQGSWFSSYWARVAAMAGGIAAVLVLGYSRYVDRLVLRAITAGLKRWTNLGVADYEWLLRMSRNYAVSELSVKKNGWLAGRSLAELELKQEGVLVLGIERQAGNYIGVPRGDTRLEPGDLVIVYGRQDMLADLDRRRADFEGQFHHVIAVTQAIEAREEECSEDEIAEAAADESAQDPAGEAAEGS